MKQLKFRTEDSIKPLKHLGQHFLKDGYYLDLISAICLEGATDILEIGCGTGNLTKKILDKGSPRLHGIETDVRSVKYLEQLREAHNNFTYEISDVRNLCYDKYRNSTFVGNLPYNIGSAIVLDCTRQMVKRMVFLLQREVVSRICSSQNTKEYGSLSVLLQTYYHVQGKLIIPPGAFYPPPQVESRLLICDLRCGQNNLPDFELMSWILRHSFSSRRKVLRNTLGLVWPTCRLYVDDGLRPEQLSVEEYIRLAFTWSRLQSEIQNTQNT